MIGPSNRALAVELIQEANQNGARLAKACQELHISVVRMNAGYPMVA